MLSVLKQQRNHILVASHLLRCLGERDANHDPLANRIASAFNRAT